MKKTPYLDFYKKHGVSPVANNVNWDLHFIQRRALYYQLGVTPGIVKDRKILEFGPGNGVNAIFTISMSPYKYTLVDANPTGIENCKKNLKHFHQDKNWQVIDSLINDFKVDEKFDLVICEGLLPNQIDPSKMTKHCASFVSDGGIFVITCHDMISQLSETLRCLPGFLIVNKIDDFDKKVEVLSNFYKPHLAYLKGMTRTPEEWVIDSILNTEFWQDAPLFSIPEAIEALEDDFIAYKTSPGFFQDWSWYKSVDSVKNHFNLGIRESYWANVHNFIDWRILSPSRNETLNKELSDLCLTIRSQIRDAANESEKIVDLIDSLENLPAYLPDENYLTKSYLESYIDGLKDFIITGKINPEKFSNFGSWWGRGMQYISFIKN